MENDIKILEEFIKISCLYGKITFLPEQLKLYQKALENLIARNKELDEELEMRIEQKVLDYRYVDENYISKSKVNFILQEYGYKEMTPDNIVAFYKEIEKLVKE